MIIFRFDHTRELFLTFMPVLSNWTFAVSIATFEWFLWERFKDDDNEKFDFERHRFQTILSTVLIVITMFLLSQKC